MVFSEIYKGSRSPLTKLRQTHPQLPINPAESPDWVRDEYADLLSKDKTKQKDAVKKYLADKVRTGWEFPMQMQALEEDESGSLENVLEDDQSVSVQQPEENNIAIAEDLDVAVHSDADDDNISDNESIYSVVSEDLPHYRLRADWSSDVDILCENATFSTSYRPDHSDHGKTATLLRRMEFKTQRRREQREEMQWNDGLACFEARREAWTGARTVRVRPKPTVVVPTSPRSPRRFFFRRSMSGSPPKVNAAAILANSAETASDTSSIAKDEKELSKKTSNRDGSLDSAADVKSYSVETLLPLAQPILPPNNPLRASITPSVYVSLYDKVILHNMQPSCPINLADMMKSCVAGWKRDGEWPPKPAPYDGGAVAVKKKPKKAPEAPGTMKTSRRLSFGIRKKETEDDSKAGKGIRRSLQRAFGIGSSIQPAVGTAS